MTIPLPCSLKEPSRAVLQPRRSQRCRRVQALKCFRAGSIPSEPPAHCVDGETETWAAWAVEEFLTLPPKTLVSSEMGGRGKRKEERCRRREAPRGLKPWAPPAQLHSSCSVHPGPALTLGAWGCAESTLQGLPARPAVLLLPFSTGHLPSLTLTFVYTRPISHPLTS